MMAHICPHSYTEELRQEDLKFKISLGNLVIRCLITKLLRGVRCNFMAGHVPGMCEALGSTFSTLKRKLQMNNSFMCKKKVEINHARKDWPSYSLEA